MDKKLRFDWDKFCFVDFRNSQEYRYLAAGFAWPGIKPGFSVIVAVDRVDDLQTKKPVFRAVDELEDPVIETFLSKCLDLRDAWEVPQWYGDPRSSAMMRMIYQLNRDLEERKKPRFGLVPPPHLDDPKSFMLFSNKIRETLQGEKKTLFTGDCEKMLGYLNDFPTEGPIKGSPEEYPAVAALGYVVTSLSLYKPWEHLPRPREPEYMPLDLRSGY